MSGLFRTLRWALLAFVLVPVIANCTGATQNAPAPGLPPLAQQQTAMAPAMQLAALLGGGKLKHVVVIVQENRSFDNLFHGFPGANTVDYGYGHDRTKYVLHPWSMLNPWDINHAHIQFLEDYDGGRNDGFDREIHGFIPNCTDPRNHPACWNFWPSPVTSYAYSYVPRSETGPYWTMATEYALGDRTFQSNNGPSYVSHQYMIAGQSNHVAENPAFPTPSPTPPNPWGCDAPHSQYTQILKPGSPSKADFTNSTGIETPGPFPCFTYRTVADTLDANHVTWAYYAPGIGTNGGEIWSAFDAISTVRFSSDWKRNVRSPETTIFNDIIAGRLPAVSWVVPNMTNSDHAGSQSASGPQWVASVVNAIGQSHYWNSTVIVVMWDDWGGWYDHVVPPQYHDSQTGVYEGLGFRVPVIVISPYAKHHYVSHKQHEIASSLHLIESVFGLPSLGLADGRADALEDMFDFTQQPSKFKPIPTRLKQKDFINQPRSIDLPPDND